MLLSGTHHSSKLQNAFEKYGLDAFAFLILERVDGQTYLTQREQYYIDNMNSFYNIARVADRPARPGFVSPLPNNSMISKIAKANDEKIKKKMQE